MLHDSIVYIFMEYDHQQYASSNNQFWKLALLFLWGQVTHICLGDLTIIGSDNGLSPGRRQAIV